MDKSIFISKNKENIGELLNFAKQKNYKIITHSFLQFEEVYFEQPKNFETIFFGSPRAVQFFLSSSIIPQGVKVACVGSGTAQKLLEFGHNSDFIGESSDTSDVAKKFKQWNGQRKVLFPVSTISLKTISSIFDSDVKEEIIVYATHIIPKSISPCDIYVFTSPSNVQAFFQTNVIQNNSKVIAWGVSTEKALAELKVDCEVLQKSSLEELITILKE